MSNIALSWAFKCHVGNASAKAVLVYLADRADDDGTAAYPKIATIVNVTELSERTVRTALKTLQERGFIRRLPDGYNTVLHGDGANLSQGQRQLLTIARAFLSDPEILILDDSSSALDFATDAKLRKAVHNLEGNTTTFLVSQRIAGIRQADQILVLGNGTLEGNGTHDELMKTCEVYREIYFSQFPEERAAYNNESGVIA